MYDNISFYLEEDAIGNKNILAHLSENSKDLKIEKRGITDQGIPYVYFSIYGRNYQKLSFMATPYILKMNGKNSSICKFVHGNNFETLTLEEFRRAIDYISNILSIDIRKAQVCRIDVSTNFIMDYQPSLYNNCLKKLSRFRKVNYHGNLYFKTQKIELNLYDKIKEYKDKGMAIPEKYKSFKNILRYEIRFKKRISRIFGKIVTIEDLCDEKFFRIIVQKWHDFYWKIQRQNPIVFGTPDSTFSTSDFKNYYMLKGMESTGGFDTVYETIQSSKKAGHITKDRAYYLSKTTRSIYSSKIAKPKIDFIKELDYKMSSYSPRIE